MKAMKKSVAILLAVCMIVPMFVLAAFTVSADDELGGQDPETSSSGTVLPEGFYLIGTFSGWSLNESCIRLTVNTSNPNEYMVTNQRFEANTEFKAVYTEDGYSVKDDKWYGQGENDSNFKLGDAGTYNIYFQPDWNNDWNGHFYAQKIAVSGYSLAVSQGDISFNVFFSDDNVNKAKFTWTGPGETARTQEKEVQNNTVTCGVPAAEMTAPIKVEYSYDSGATYVTAPGTQTVAALANRYLEGDFAENAKALAKAILVYGAAAQKQFSFRGNDLATQDTPDEYTADDIETYDDGAVNVPDKTQMPDLSAYGLNYEGCTLLLQSTTSLRFYFTKNDAFAGDVNVKYGDSQLDLRQYGTGKYWYVEIPNIGAGMLDNAQTLAVTKGENTAALGDYSTLSYVKAALGGSDDTLKNTVRAFYGFYLAAQKYQRANVITVY